jgi:hypothetical protein
MTTKRKRDYTVKTLVVLCLFFAFSINLTAQDQNLWNDIDSVNIDSAYSLFSEKDLNTIVGIWESSNGVIFMIDECYDNEGVVTYQMCMLKDRIYYGNWHIRIPEGQIIGLLSNTSDSKIYGCRFKLKKNNDIEVFHLSLTSNKLVYTGSSNLRRKLFAVKIYPIAEKSKKEQKPTTPLNKSLIEKEFSK